MLCSAERIRTRRRKRRIISLPQDAAIGEDLRDYLKLDDYIIDVSITPNRGDCLSIKGFAREVSAINKNAFRNSVVISEEVKLQFKIHYPLQLKRKRVVRIM